MLALIFTFLWSYEQLKTYFQASSQEICAILIIFHILKQQ